MTTVFRVIDAGIRWLEHLFMMFSSALLALMALLGTADVLSLNLFGHPVPSATELAATMLAIAVMMGMSHTQRQNAHIRVDLFWKFFPRPIKIFVEGLSLVIGLCVFVLITWGAWQLAQHSIDIWEVAVASVRFPIWPFKLGFFLGALVCALELLRELLRFLFAGDRLTDPEAGPVVHKN